MNTDTLIGSPAVEFVMMHLTFAKQNQVAGLQEISAPFYTIFGISC